MADTTRTIPREAVRHLKVAQINRLPYGILEVNSTGLILDYFPFQSQANGAEPRQICGLNLFDDILPTQLLGELRQSLPALATRTGSSERLLLILPFADQTIRLSIVATKTPDGPQVRISLIRLANPVAPAPLSRFAHSALRN